MSKTDEIFSAVEEGNLDKLKALWDTPVTEGSNPSNTYAQQFRAINTAGQTVLTCLADSPRREFSHKRHVFNWLLSENRVPITLSNLLGQNVFHHLANRAEDAALSKNDALLFAELLTHASNKEIATKDHGGFTPLHYLAQHNKLEHFRFWRIARKGPVDTLTAEGETALHIAVKVGHGDFADACLLSDPALLDKKNGLGHTPLMLAAKQGDVGSFIRLSGWQAKLTKKDEDGLTPFLHAAASSQLSVVKHCIDQYGQEILKQGDSKGNNAFLLAAAAGSLECLSFLLERDATLLLSRNKAGNYLGHVLLEAGHTTLLDNLLSNEKYKADFPLLKTNRKGKNLLDIARQSGAIPEKAKDQVVRYLLQQAPELAKVKGLVGGARRFFGRGGRIKMPFVPPETVRLKTRLARYQTNILPASSIEQGEIIGEGQSAVCYKGLYKSDNGDFSVVLKELKVEEYGEEGEQGVARELKALSQLNSPYIVHFFGYYQDAPQNLFYLVLEQMKQGSLNDFLHHADKAHDFTPGLIYQLAWDIASGLHDLHQQRVIHGGLKTASVLLNDEYRGKLSNFASSKVQGMTTVAGTMAFNQKKLPGRGKNVAYEAPELHDGASATAQSDIYSYGMILWELIAQQIPFQGLKDSRIMGKIANGERENLSVIDTATQGAFAALSPLIHDCWQADPTQRPTMERILQTLETNFPKPLVQEELSSDLEGEFSSEGEEAAWGNAAGGVLQHSIGVEAAMFPPQEERHYETPYSRTARPN